MGRSLCLLLPLPETFHFHLTACSVPCNLHLCSYSCTQGHEEGLRGDRDQAGLGHRGAGEGDLLSRRRGLQPLSTPEPGWLGSHPQAPHLSPALASLGLCGGEPEGRGTCGGEPHREMGAQSWDLTSLSSKGARRARAGPQPPRTADSCSGRVCAVKDLGPPRPDKPTERC